MFQPAHSFPTSLPDPAVDDEVSGIRTIPVWEVDVTIDAVGDEPATAYAVVRGLPFRIFLGVSFSEGVLENPDWAMEMRRAGASAEAVAQCESWLRLHRI